MFLCADEAHDDTYILILIMMLPPCTLIYPNASLLSKPQAADHLRACSSLTAHASKKQSCHFTNHWPFGTIYSGLIDSCKAPATLAKQ